MNLMNFTGKQYDVIRGQILSYLCQGDLWACSLINKTWGQLAKSKLWCQPEFGNERSTSLQAFQQFLRTLKNVGSETTSLIQVIDVSQIQESLYETLDDNWLTIVIQNCSNLRSLIIRDVPFLTTMAIRKLITNCKRDHINLQYLNLEHSKNVTENLLKSFIQKFPELLAINLNSCSGVSDSSISQISYYCQDLNTIDISNSRSRVTDVSIYAIAKFGKQKLKNLNFSSMQKISDNSINTLANHCKHLEVVNLSNCSQLISSSGLENLLMANKNSLKELWMHNMKGVPVLTQGLWELIAIRCEKLKVLSISFNAIYHSFPFSTQDKCLIYFYFSRFKSLNKLILYDIPEHASAKFIWCLIECCGIESDDSGASKNDSNRINDNLRLDLNPTDRRNVLKEVSIYRAEFESDFILGGYAKSKTSTETFGKDDEEVNEDWANKFNEQHLDGPKIKLIRLVESVDIC
ncbi:1719_t:CDS:1 [Acaulospora morrowiae]|uniref:1719_t:CDS:1 n=1 Tax=Acaulospora morrowiae TaxID=94023 RepID=A0A9N8V5R2_9GLOM|nr:1719_t:CDS:1 [Acaulospora morrowiae]